MTDLADKASEARVNLIADARFIKWRLNTTELKDSDEINSSDEFPKYGEYVVVSDPETPVEDAEEQYVECVQELAQELVEHDIGPGDVFEIVEATKENNRWSVRIAWGE